MKNVFASIRRIFVLTFESLGSVIVALVVTVEVVTSYVDIFLYYDHHRSDLPSSAQLLQCFQVEDYIW